ncbi:GAF domain-containing protein [Kitasatospora sp. MAP12-15]|uniref:SpoIIE family protein phosphatase n=1 Tax=unclassified Kitasatospora TaxID=2633591 RepID=UPI0024740358|nr:SpoIIE family protein phosphatase [Kitasatospora sp. MAP12-44]MDH6112166.1 GAF domain-containing protein [Kitasatospora sp. MAP12-44]
MDLTSPWPPPSPGPGDPGTSGDRTSAHSSTRSSGHSSTRSSARSTVSCARILLRCTSAAEMLGTLLAEGPGWITGEGSAIYLLDAAGMLRLTVSNGLPEWAHERYGTIDPAGDLPAAVALRRREPVLLSPERSSVHFPNPVAGFGTGLVAVAALPLLVDDRELGVLALSLAHRGTVPRRDLDALALLAESCAHRLAHLIDHGPAVDGAPRGVRTHAEQPDGYLAQPLLADALRAAGAGAFERDLVTGETAWDASAYRVVGRVAPTDGGPLPAPDLGSLVHPEDLADVQAALVDALASAGPYRLGYRVIRPDGGTSTVDEHGEVLLDVHGRPVRIAGLLVERDRGQSPEPAAEPAAAPVAEARSALLLALTRALSRAVTVRDVTEAMTDIARPALGAADLVLDLVDEGRLLPVSPSVYGGSRRGELNRLHELSSSAMEQSLARSVPLFSEPGAGTNPAAWAVLPLVASGRQVGSCLITFATDRAFSREDRTLYSAFAGILAQSLERARLYDTHHHRATELQRAMLPRSLPTLPGLTAAARYLPSTEGMQIGGDWYDLFRLSAGKVGMVIGDVQGHNAEATAVMGQLRSGLRAYATDGHDPAATLARTSRLLAELDTELFATCLYLTLDLADGVVCGARAGHPAPVRISDGRAVELELPGGPPLGVDPTAAYPLAVERLGLGETLLSYTDGLVEDRAEDYDESVQRMLGGLELWSRQAGPGRVGPAAALERLADLLTLNVTERNSRPDDVALLLLHRTSPAAG